MSSWPGLGWLLKGALLGLSIAAPVGPIGVLCIRRSLAEGAAMGFVCGLGAATADALYALAAGFALTALSEWLVHDGAALMLPGGLFLIYLGARTFITRPAIQAANGRPEPQIPHGSARRRAAYRAFLSTLLLTLANPTTILSFAAVFAGVGASLARSTRAHDIATLLLVAGVFAGSALWWLILSSSVGRLRGRIGPRALKLVNPLSGLILTGFGLYALLRLLQH
jgi:threonine/homoserine/homoserine lactone efflux protein